MILLKACVETIADTVPTCGYGPAFVISASFIFDDTSIEILRFLSSHVGGIINQCQAILILARFLKSKLNSQVAFCKFSMFLDYV